MKTILLAAAIAFAVTAAIGMPVIHWLRKMKFGQKILEIGTEVAYEQAEYSDHGRLYVHDRHRREHAHYEHAHWQHIRRRA